jgi:surface antigen
VTAPPRSLPCALLLAVVLALLAPVAPAEAASRYLCTGYHACQQSGHPHFGYRKAGSRMWWRMYTGHNCTNYVAYRMVRQGMSSERPWDGTGMAYNWGRANRRLTDDTPMVGSVAWWNAGDGVGSSGHVAYVERVISKRRIVISEDSWGGDFHWREIRKQGGGWPTGFIHFDDREVRPVEQPVVTGDAAVGKPLTLTVGRWSPAASYAVQWLAGGAPIDGATGTTLTPTPVLRGKRLSVRVTATARGHLPGTATTARTAKVQRGTMTVVTPPTLSGTARVDEVLTLSTGTTSPAATGAEIRWFADGTLLDGATGPRLRLGQQLIRKRITATVVSRRTGYRNLTTTTAATAPVQAGRFEISAPFTLAGRAHLGRRLTVAPGTYAPADARVSYTWLRGNQPIDGATGPSYVVEVGDVGRRLSVRVDLRHPGYRDASRTLTTAAPVTTPSTTRVIARGRPHRAVVTVRVTAPGVAAPAGRATVRVGKRTLVGQVRDGRLRIVFRDLPRGSHQVRVRYQGADPVLPSRATTTVRVPRR